MKATNSDPADPSRRRTDDSGSGDRVSIALEEYAAAIDQGRPITREALLSKYSDVAEELAGCLGSLDFIHQVAPQVDDTSRVVGEKQSNDNAETTPRAALGDYQIVRELGRGGMGVVYEAEQLSLGRKVALKVLPFASMLDERKRIRFKNEARAAATLDHPGIVSVFGTGEDRGVHYYAMQLVDGNNLAEVIHELRSAGRSVDERGGGESLSQLAENISCDLFAVTEQSSNSADSNTVRVSTRSGTDVVSGISSDRSKRRREYFQSVARIGRQAALALDHAHTQGIVHRDIKPANLMIDADGRVYVTDFGLAYIGSDVGMTITGDLIGTLRYMSPEQALAQRVIIDHRTDVYSLGITIYELLTLQAAFEGADRQRLLQQIAFEDPKPPRSRVAEIPKDLETIVLKACAKNPQERYATMAEMADDLQCFLEQRPIKAKPPSVLDRVSKWGRRHVALVASTAAILLVSTIALSIASVLVARENQETQVALSEAKYQQGVANVQLQAATEAREQAEVAERRASEDNLALQRELYAADMKFALEAKQAQDEFRLLDLLKKYIPGDGERDLRGFEWAYLWESRKLKRYFEPGGLLLPAPIMNAIAYSPDGSLLAVSKGDTVKLWDAKTWSLKDSFDAGVGAILNLQFSPDGKKLGAFAFYSTVDGRLSVRDLATRSEIFRRTPGGFFTFLDQGRTLAVGPTFRREIRLWDLESKNRIRVIQKPFHGGFAISPDGQRVVIGGAGTGIRNLQEEPGEFSINAKLSIVGPMDFSPDGSLLAGFVGKELHTLDARDLSLVKHLGTAETGFLRFSPDNEHLISLSGSTLESWNHVTGEKRVLISGLQPGPGAGTPLDLAPAGDSVAFWNGGRRIGILDLQDTPNPSVLRLPGGAETLLFSPDSRTLAVGGDDRVMMIDVESGDPIFAFNGLDGLVTSTSFSPDGRWFAVGDDRHVRLWDLVSGVEVFTRRYDKGSRPKVVISHDGTRLIVGAVQTGVHHWDIESFEEIESYHVATGASGFSHPTINSVACSPQGLLAIVHRGVDDSRPSVLLHDLETGSRWTEPLSNGLVAGSIAFAPDGRASIPLTDSRVLVTDPRVGTDVPPRYIHHGGQINATALTRDGGALVSAQSDGTVRFWGLQTLRERVTFREHEGDVPSIAFSPDGSTLASSGRDGTIRLWRSSWPRRSSHAERFPDLDLADFAKREISTPESIVGAVSDVEFSADGRQMLLAGDTSCRVWDLDGQRVLWQQEYADGEPFHQASFSTDGRFVIATDSFKMFKMDALTGRVTESISLQTELPKDGFSILTRAVLSPDKSHLSVGQRWYAPVVKILNTSDGTLERTIESGENSVWGIAYSEDSSLIATGHADGGLKLWSTDSGDPRATLLGHADTV